MRKNMKTFLTLMLIVTFFNGCSQKNAFSEFNITQNQEKGEENLLSSKIYGKNGVDGIVSAIYLNKIFPKRYQDGEYFYIALYLQNDKKSLKFFLNKRGAIKVTHLPASNAFSKIVSFQGTWKDYYLVKFHKSTQELQLSVQNAHSSSQKMLFKKED